MPNKIHQLVHWLSKISHKLSNHTPSSSPPSSSTTVSTLNKSTKRQSKRQSSSAVLRNELLKLPIELVTHIFILAAYDPDLIPLTLRLLRTARWVHDIVQPILYHSVHLKTDVQATKFLKSITVKPELCRLIVTFDSPQVNIFKRAWSKRHIQDLCLPYVAALEKRAPHPQSLAKIFLVLLQDEPTIVNSAERSSTSLEWAHVVGSPRAPKLRSVTIHALSLSPTFEVSTSNYCLGSPYTRLPADVTLSGFGTSNLTRAHFTNVQRLRFTSVVNGGTLRITDLMALPNLTHLALPLWRSTCDTTKILLSSERLQRLALFVLFDPISEEELLKATSEEAGTGSLSADPATQINQNNQPLNLSQAPFSSSISSNQPTTSSSMTTTTTITPSNTVQPTTPNPMASTSSLHDVFLESEALKEIHDPRLILFNIRELVTLCQVPTGKFWDEVELRATHPVAHVILGKLRSLAGQNISER